MPVRRLTVLLAVLLVCVSAAVVRADSGNPFVGARMVADPDSPAHRQVAAWQTSRPADAALIAKLADQPTFNWLGDWLPNPGGYTSWWIRTKLAPRQAIALLAVYDLPHRDCSGRWSAGGAPDAAAYRAFVDQVATAIGAYPAIVVVEPDGLPDAACLAAAARRRRLALVRYAAQRFSGLAHTTVYLDAGRSDWKPAGTIVGLLRAAGVTYTRGFSLDVTGYAFTRDELRYGDRISRALGGKHCIVNTSRNGRGPLPRGTHLTYRTETWCNTPGRALGARPTSDTGDPRADAFAWVLHPGFSDGSCNGGPKAGTWWPSYALGLARRAAW